MHGRNEENEEVAEEKPDGNVKDVICMNSLNDVIALKECADLEIPGRVEKQVTEVRISIIGALKSTW